MKGQAPRESWEALSRRHTDAEAAAQKHDEDTVEEMVMRALTGRPGCDFLEWLRSETIDKRNRPGCSEAELRELEAQRQLVTRIEKLRDRGIEIAAARAKAVTP